MAIIDLRSQTGVLQRAIEQRTELALACGALQPIITRQETLHDCGVRFLVRSVSSLDDKRIAASQDKQDEGDDYNPFLPPDPALTVADVSDTHRAVLNKFNVIDHHLLIITRRFEHQEELLTYADFHALWRCLREIDGLGFYNGGKVAGASQRHKHLQLIPLPMLADTHGTPMDGVWSKAPQTGRAMSFPDLVFPHLFLRLPETGSKTLEETAAYSLQAYREMLQQLGIRPQSVEGAELQAAPYNLLLTRRWMLLVPRSRERCEGISVNALGFAGSLFVRNEKELSTVKRIGPMNILRAVSR